MFDLIVANGTLVLPDGVAAADLGVRAGRIAAIGHDLGEARERIDAAGRHVLPGLVDEHVHFREPGMTHKEDFATGTLAASLGGVTTILDMPNTSPPTRTGALLRAKRDLVAPGARVDHGLYGIILPDNEDELDGLADEGAIGFKLFLGETTGNNPAPDDATVFGAFRRIAALDRVVAVHAENNAILQRLKNELRASGRTDARAHLDARPWFVEAEAIGRSIAIAEATGAHLHVVHVSTAQGVDMIAAARARGVRVTAEALVAHLLLDDSAYERHGNLAQVNPPIRERHHSDALWAGIAAGTIDCVATDHAPHTREEQLRANVWEGVGGFGGVELMLPLMLTEVARGRLTLERLIELTSANPARIFGLAPRKGGLRLGADADFVLVDLGARWTIDAARLSAKHAISPFHGTEAVGRVVATYLRGACIARDGQPVGQPRGQFLRTGRQPTAAPSRAGAA